MRRFRILFLALPIFAVAWLTGRRAADPDSAVTRLYDVRDILLIAPPEFDNPPDLGLGSPTSPAAPGPTTGPVASLVLTPTPPAGAAPPGLVRPPRPATADPAGRVAALVRESIDPTSWGSGGRALSELSGTLLVTHTPATHARVERLLADLRAAQGLMVVIEVRLVAADEAILAALPPDARVALAPATRPRAAADGPPVFLTNAQVNALLNAAQTSPVPGTTVTYTAPRLTLFAGQQAYVLVATQRAYVAAVAPGGGAAGPVPQLNVVESGVLVEARAAPTPDCEFVHLTARIQSAALLGMEPVTTVAMPIGPPLKVERPTSRTTELRLTARIPAGRTLLVPLSFDLPSPGPFAATRPAAIGPSPCAMLIRTTVVAPPPSAAVARFREP